MKILHRLISISLICIFFNLPGFSQSPYIYDIPATAHGLKLKEKGDLSFSTGILIQEENSSFSSGPVDVFFYSSNKHSSNFQLAYSILERVSISFNHDRIKTKNRKENKRVFHNSHLTGIGIGTYHTLKLERKSKPNQEKNKVNKNRSVLIDLHLGYGRGRIENQYFVYDAGDVSLKLQKYYVQSGIHFIGKHLDVSYMLKFGQINYLSGVINGKQDSSDFQTIRSVTEVSKFAIWENTIKAEFKFRKFGLFSQATTSSNQEFSRGQWTSNVFHLGLSVNLQTTNWVK